MELTFLGTGAGNGVPLFYCDCQACKEAKANPAFSRMRSAILISGPEGNTLIDTPPDIRSQLLRQNISDIERVFLTHDHYDHFGGMGDLHFYVSLKRKKPLDVYLHKEIISVFEDAFSFMTESVNLIPLTIFQKYDFKDLNITPIKANHGVNGLGFIIKSKLKIAYLPDTYYVPEETREYLHDVDILIVDSTFFEGSLFKKRAHMTVDEAIDFGRQIGAKTTYLTHLSMHYTKMVTNKFLEEYLKPKENVNVAYDGLTLQI